MDTVQGCSSEPHAREILWVALRMMDFLNLRGEWTANDETETRKLAACVADDNVSCCHATLFGMGPPLS